ncbi:hypothetical protein ACS45_07675 [Bacillus cereus]|nr:hypothetical protein ACS45_07675 [Bacillus cereus]
MKTQCHIKPPLFLGQCHIKPPLFLGDKNYQLGFYLPQCHIKPPLFLDNDSQLSFFKQQKNKELTLFFCIFLLILF